MSAPARYLFEIDFSAPATPAEDQPEVVEVPTITVEEHEQLLAAARQQAFEDGRQGALTGIEAAAAETRNHSAAEIGTRLAEILDIADRERERIEALAVDLGLSAARKLARGLIAKEPVAEITHLLSECLAPLRAAPHLVLRVHEALVEDLKPEADRLAYEAGFEGRLVILGEDDIAMGDCRIEWADGGQVLSIEETDKTIQSLVDAYLVARTAKGAAEDQMPPAKSAGGLGNESHE